MQLSDQIKILVVEDNEGFAQLLHLMLEELNLKKIWKATSLEEAWSLFNKVAPDLCLIDIELGKGEMEGIHLAEKIRAQSPTLPFIYLTVHYQEEVFKQCKHTGPSSFMNKELSRLTLYQALELALLHQNRPVPGSSGPQPPSAYPTGSIPWINNQHFFFKVGETYHQFAIKDIAFFYAKGKMTFAKIDKRNFLINVQLKTLEDELFPQFLRIHKSYLVNAKAVDSINLKDSLIEIAEERLPIGYAYRKDFLDRLKLLK
jgi:DNA-binding LytR/AlgR family response regulator